MTDRTRASSNGPLPANSASTSTNVDWALSRVVRPASMVGHARAGPPLLDRDAAVLDDANLVDSRGGTPERLAGQHVVEDPIPLQGRLRLAEPDLRDSIVVDLVYGSLQPLTQQSGARPAGPAVQDPSRFVVGGAVHRAIFLQNCLRMLQVR
jgi:hypothetical protein